MVTRNSGYWSSWGRGYCQGHSLEMGEIIRIIVRKLPGTGRDPADCWQIDFYGLVSSSNGKQFPDRDSAIKLAEQELERAMRGVVDSWIVYRAQKLRAHLPPIRPLK